MMMQKLSIRPRKLTYHIPFLKGPIWNPDRFCRSFLLDRQKEPLPNSPKPSRTQLFCPAPFELVLLRDSSPLRSGGTDPSLPVGGKPGVLLRKPWPGFTHRFPGSRCHSMGCLVRGARVFTGDFFRKIMVPKTHIVGVVQYLQNHIWAKLEPFWPNYGII